MAGEPKSNKLNIYLIKEQYSDYDDITNIDKDTEIFKIEISGVGILYYKKSEVDVPDWVESFFKNNREIIKANFLGSGSKAVLIVNIENNRKSRFFAIPFGTGRFLLKDDCMEERFGLMTCLNLIEASKIRAIDKKTITKNPLISREQISKASGVSEFQMDFEKDLIKAVTGKSLIDTFGKTVTGKESFSVSAKVDINNIKGFLKTCFIEYQKKNYRKNFEWVDQIKEVESSQTVTELYGELINTLKDYKNEKLTRRNNNSIWLAVPEIIDWENFIGYRYSVKKKDKLFEELDISDYLETIKEAKEISIKQMSKTNVTCWAANNNREDYIKRWNIFSCVNAEIEYMKGKYILDNGDWYEIDSDFVKTINKDFNSTEMAKLNVPAYNNQVEGKYNILAAKKLKAECLDCDLVAYGGGKSKIEFCDILTSNKKIIHVKKNSGSALLSHLFEQGKVSAELLITDKLFRKELRKKLKENKYKRTIPLQKAVAAKYKIIFAIITQKKEISIPFFSKVALKNTKKALEAYGFKVLLCNIK